MSFTTWLSEQIERGDAVAELASFMAQYPHEDLSTYPELEQFLEGCDGLEHLDAAYAGWAEFARS